MNKKFFIIVAILSIAGLSFYTYLGGFSKPAIEHTTTETLYIAGRYYEGLPKGELFNEIFQQAGEAVEKGTLKGDLGGIYYNNPDESGDTIKAFVGVVVADKNVALPQHYEIRTVEAGQKVLKGRIKAHMLLAPNKLYNAIFEYAEKNNIRLKPFYVEWFPSKQEAVVQVAVQE